MEKSKPSASRGITVFPIITLLLVPAIVSYLAYKPATAFTMDYSRAICGLFAIGSIIEITVKIAIVVIQKIKKRQYQLNILLRPSVALIAAVAAIYYLTAIENKAKAYLWQIATKTQAICEVQNRSPDLPDGWSEKSYTYYVNSTYFNMRYVTPDKQNFYIFLHYGLGSGFVALGGINKKIEMRRTH